MSATRWIASRHVFFTVTVRSSTLLLLAVIFAPVRSSAQSPSQPTTRPRTNAENRQGDASVTMNFPAGTLTLGDAKVITAQGLSSVDAIYQESPNEFDLPWNQVKLNITASGESSVKSLETGRRSNFISLVPDNGMNEMDWVPFEAIDSMTITKQKPQKFSGASNLKEIYGRFSFEYQKAGTGGDLSSKAYIQLIYPLPNGKSQISGFLADQDASTYDGLSWHSVPWSSISSIRFNYSSPPTTLPTHVPNFTYRELGRYSNVWHEYGVGQKTGPTSKP